MLFLVLLLKKREKHKRFINSIFSVLLSISFLFPTVPARSASLPAWLRITSSIEHQLEALVKRQEQLDEKLSSLQTCVASRSNASYEPSRCESVGHYTQMLAMEAHSMIQTVIVWSKDSEAQPLPPSFVENLSYLQRLERSYYDLFLRLSAEDGVSAHQMSNNHDQPIAAESCAEIKDQLELFRESDDPFQIGQNLKPAPYLRSLEKICRSMESTRLHPVINLGRPRLGQFGWETGRTKVSFEEMIIEAGEENKDGREDGNCSGARCPDGDRMRGKEDASGSGEQADRGSAREGTGPGKDGSSALERGERADYRHELFQQWVQEGGKPEERPQAYSDDEVIGIERGKFDVRTKSSVWTKLNSFTGLLESSTKQFNRIPVGELYWTPLPASEVESQGLQKRPGLSLGPDVRPETSSVEELRSRNSRAHMNLMLSQPRDGWGKQAKAIGLAATSDASEALKNGDLHEANAMVQVAEVMADVVVSSLPFVGVAKDLIELVSGTSIITGKPLSEGDRWMAALGVLSAGSFGMFKAGIKLVDKVKDATPVTKTLIKELHNVVVKTADEVNEMLRASRGYTENAYMPGSRVYEFTTPSEMVGTHVRVFQKGQRLEGKWIMEKNAVNGLSPEGIAKKFSLPRVPTHIVDVTIPKGVRMRKGVSARVMEGVGEKWYSKQYELVDDVPREWFSSPRELE